MRRIVCNFSCGASSAVAAKITVEAYAATREVVVLYLDTSADEHPDNMRFLAECEQWIGVPILRLRNEKYTGIDDVFLKDRYIVGPTGAPCTKRLKRQVGNAFIKPDDTIVLGYTADERHRIEAFELRNPYVKTLWVLALGGITKIDCIKVIQSVGIELPAMYKLGYSHNNCIGCVKGGKGYWNQIRRDFPDVFAKRAAVERNVGAAILGDVYLDELDPEAGRSEKAPDIECGMFCSSYSDFISETAKTLQEKDTP